VSFSLLVVLLIECPAEIFIFSYCYDFSTLQLLHLLRILPHYFKMTLLGKCFTPVLNGNWKLLRPIVPTILISFCLGRHSNFKCEEKWCSSCCEIDKYICNYISVVKLLIKYIRRRLFDIYHWAMVIGTLPSPRFRDVSCVLNVTLLLLYRNKIPMMFLTQ